MVLFSAKILLRISAVFLVEASVLAKSPFHKKNFSVHRGERRYARREEQKVYF